MGYLDGNNISEWMQTRLTTQIHDNMMWIRYVLIVSTYLKDFCNTIMSLEIQ